MAQVSVDISEYDMLREGKKAAEARVKTLEKDIDGLRNGTSAIIKTRYVSEVIDWDKFGNALNRYRDIHPYGNLHSTISPVFSDGCNITTAEIMQLLKPCVKTITPNPHDEVEYTIIGFEDVRDIIETSITKAAQQDIERLEKSLEAERNSYVALKDKLELNLKAKYENEIGRLKENYEEKLSRMNKECEETKEKLAGKSKECEEAKDMLARECERSRMLDAELSRERSKKWFRKLFGK